MSQPNSLTDPRYRAPQEALKILWLKRPGIALRSATENFPELAEVVEGERG